MVNRVESHATCASRRTVTSTSAMQATANGVRIFIENLRFELITCLSVLIRSKIAHKDSIRTDNYLFTAVLLPKVLSKFRQRPIRKGSENGNNSTTYSARA